MRKIHRLILALFVGLINSTAMSAGKHEGEHHSTWEAIGQPGKAAKVTRTVMVEMKDTMRFAPSKLTVKQGETIKFVLKNSGNLPHEMVLGTEKELEEHYELMKKFPEMEHAEPNQVTVQAGGSGEIIWEFTKAGVVNFACLQPGHYEAGMKGSVFVNGKAKSIKGSTSHRH